MSYIFLGNVQLFSAFTVSVCANSVTIKIRFVWINLCWWVQYFRKKLTDLEDGDLKIKNDMSIIKWIAFRCHLLLLDQKLTSTKLWQTLVQTILTRFYIFFEIFENTMLNMLKAQIKNFESFAIILLYIKQVLSKI